MFAFKRINTFYSLYIFLCALRTQKSKHMQENIKKIPVNIISWIETFKSSIFLNSSRKTPICTFFPESPSKICTIIPVVLFHSFSFEFKIWKEFIGSFRDFCLNNGISCKDVGFKMDLPSFSSQQQLDYFVQENVVKTENSWPSVLLQHYFSSLNCYLFKISLMIQ